MPLEMTRIETPPWAPPHARHVVDVEDGEGERAKALAAPHLAAIWTELHRQIEMHVNDPDRCFLDEAEGFPVRERLDGNYYIGSETYEGEEGPAGTTCRLWLFARCLEHEWTPNQRQSGYDYLGLEAIVTIAADGSGFEFDDGLTSSVI